jgi:hypothetical protein
MAKPNTSTLELMKSKVALSAVSKIPAQRCNEQS